MSDDITTIFVVGFPEDMREREFQNMFTFSPGFEAATLKIPSSEDDRDAQKKQIIGFAKFHSRLEALEARDVLTGRKVDAEKNCVLKAEMAKKNLHTKRGLSSLGLSTAMAATFGLDTPTTGLSFQQHSQTPSQQHTPGPSVPRTASLTNTMLASGNRPEHLRISAARTFNPFNDIPLASAPILGANAHRGFGNQYSSAFSSNGESIAVSAAAPQPGTAGVMGGFMYGEQMAPMSTNTHPSMLLNRRGSMHSSTPVSMGVPSATLGMQGSMQGIQAGATSERSSTDGETQPMAKSGQRPAVLDISGRLGQLGLGQMSSMVSPMGMPYSAALTTPSGMVLPMATTRSVNSNDQNPPCNTLYVGNLPVGAKEDELRSLFHQSLGYKRMSYKAKPNSGPMCFVEFESIDFATLAMSDLDGRMLSNSVGGGIRLSYSKNPLGVRSQMSSGVPSSAMLNSAAVAAASAAMTSGYVGNGTAFGYPMALQQPLQKASLRPHATPSPPGQARVPTQHSSNVSPIPSPGAKDNVPRDALSFLHQPIHQMHKQSHDANGSGSTTPPSSSAQSDVALKQ
ncbi:hypothetical protein IWW56_001052 [Coemansia sp. RSA 2131]|nr:hypothetical protein IWW56_001052 [Coemansia sp. RSA 2131]